MMTSQPQKKSTKKKQINQPRDRANYTVDKEDADALKGKRPSYILGWNKVKYRGKLDA